MTDGQIQAEIQIWKEKRRAVILAHNYVEPEVQDAADFVGDSLELSVRAAETRSPVIVFCGVSFMAETAKILSPGSAVLHPVRSAGCPMADMAEASEVAAWRREHPGAAVVAYVNTTAAVKAEADVCCTSGNAAQVVRSIPPDRRILFLPDQNLGANISEAVGRKMDLWPGFCPTHNRIMPDTIMANRRAHPGAVLLAHPECLPAVVKLADYALSTGGMLRKVRESAARSFLIATEHGIIHRMRRENPGKEFIALEPAVHCPNMKKITLESVLEALRTMSPQVELPEDLMERAHLPIERMLRLTR